MLSPSAGGARAARALGARLRALGAAAAAAAEAPPAQQQQRGYAAAHPLAVRGVDALRGGPGGRSSTAGVAATVFGATGFLGRYVAQALGKVGAQLVLPHRCDPVDCQHLRVMGDLGQIAMPGGFDVRDEAAVRAAIRGSSVVVNLIGADRETWNFSFDDVHVHAAARIARVAREEGVQRFVHVSALGAAPDAPSRRLRSKAAGEAAVRAELGEAATVLRLAALTGTEDRLFNAYASLAKRLPFVPLVAGGAARRQPLWVRDAAAAVLAALQTWDSAGRTYSVAGPDVLTLRELAEFTYETIRERALVLPVPLAAARAAAAPGDWLAARSPFRPNAPMFTADGAAEAAADIVAPPAGAPGALLAADLGLAPHRVTEGIPIEYLRHYRVGGYEHGTTSQDARAGGAGGGGWQHPG